MHGHTFANPSAVPVCVPKKIVTFFLPSSTSTSGSFTINGLGGSTALGFEPLDLRQIKTTTHPIRTAIEVVKIIKISRLSRMREATSFKESEETLEGSTLPLMMADIRSNGEIFMELDEDCIPRKTKGIVSQEPRAEPDTDKECARSGSFCREGKGESLSLMVVGGCVVVEARGGRERL